MNNNNLNKLASSTIKVFMLSAASMVLGFIRQIVIANEFGSTAQTDTYYMAYNIENALFASLISCFASIIIPNYIMRRKDEKEGLDYLSGFFSMTSIIVLGISAILFFFSEIIINNLAPGFSVPNKEATIVLFRCLLVLPFLTNLNNLCSAVLNAEKAYLGVQIRGIIANILAIGIIIAFSVRLGVKALLISVIASQLIQTVMICIRLRGIKTIRPDFRCFRKEISSTLVGMIPLSAGMILTECQHVVDNYFVSRLPEGGVSAISYTTALMPFFALFFHTPIKTVVFPEIWERISNKEDFSGILSRGYKIMLLLMIPFVLGTFLLRREVISIVYYRGSFTYEAMINTASIIGIYVSCLAITSSINYFSTVFVANRMFYVSAISGVATLTVNIIGNALLINRLKLIGLALATLFAQIVNFTIQQVWLNHRFHCVRYKDILITIKNSTIAGVSMFCIGKLLRHLLIEMSLFPKTITIVIVCSIAYFAILQLLHDNDYSMLKRIVKDKVFNLLKISKILT